MDHVTLEIEDRIAIVTLKRPPVNALSFQTFNEIKEVFDSLSSSRHASVAILRSSPDLKLFCGGVSTCRIPRNDSALTAASKIASRSSMPAIRSTPARSPASVFGRSSSVGFP